MKIYYVYDPLCVFCYGFSPLMHKLYKKYNKQFDFELLPGGLWIDEKVKKVTPQVAVNLKGASEKVTQMSGQLFGEGFYRLLKRQLVFDSFVGSKAMTTINTMALSDPFDYLELIYQSTFVEGNDSNDLSVYTKAAEKLALDGSLFTRHFLSDEIFEKTYDLIKKGKTLGATSYPTVLIEKEDKLYSYPLNYGSFSALEDWLLETKNH